MHSYAMPLRAHPRITSHWMTGGRGARTLACRVGTFADAHSSRAPRRRVRLDAPRKSACATAADCEVIFAWCLGFRKAGIRHNWRADPLVRAGRPRPALLLKNRARATLGYQGRSPCLAASP